MWPYALQSIFVFSKLKKSLYYTTNLLIGINSSQIAALP